MKNVLQMNFSADRSNKKIDVVREFDAPVEMGFEEGFRSALKNLDKILINAANE